MDLDRVLEAFRRESEALTDAVSGLSPAEWNIPTRCTTWDRPRFLRKATGREPLDESETTRIGQLGIRWLALG